MPTAVYAQLVGLCVGALLVSAVLLVWRRSLRASIRLLVLQGFALSALVAVIGLDLGDVQLFAIGFLVLALKGVILPRLLAGSGLAEAAREDTPLMNPTASLITASLLTGLAYLVTPAFGGPADSPTTRAVPVGIALVLIGFLLLVTRRRALSQLVGFLLIDNGIAAVAFLTAAGVPLVVEFGASLDVLLIVLILQALRGRMLVKFGNTDLTELTELHD
jgi:hydrogenase-4 component E